MFPYCRIRDAKPTLLLRNSFRKEASNDSGSKSTGAKNTGKTTEVRLAARIGARHARFRRIGRILRSLRSGFRRRARRVVRVEHIVQLAVGNFIQSFIGKDEINSRNATSSARSFSGVFSGLSVAFARGGFGVERNGRASEVTGGRLFGGNLIEAGFEFLLDLNAARIDAAVVDDLIGVDVHDRVVYVARRNRSGRGLRVEVNVKNFSLRGSDKGHSQRRDEERNKFFHFITVFLL